MNAHLSPLLIIECNFSRLSFPHTDTHKKRRNQIDGSLSLSVSPTLFLFLLCTSDTVSFPPPPHPTTRYIGWKYDWSGKKKRRSNPSGTSNPISCYDVPQPTSLSSYRSKANDNNPLPPPYSFFPMHYSKSLLSLSHSVKTN